MDLIQIVFLALVQGLTEFLPISSSSHLILVPLLSDWPDQGLSFDIAVHVGTLLAVIAYFRKELLLMSQSWANSVLNRQLDDNGRLAWAVLLGTIPVGLVGLLGKTFIETHLRSPVVIAVATITFGLLLWYAYAKGKRRRDEHTLDWRDVLLIGCAQALALIPGTSRSGITITAGLFAGLTGEAAARFSFLLSIPAIALPGLLLGKDLLDASQQIVWQELFIGALLSGVSAYLCIGAFLRFLNRIGMAPFAIYRLLLGVILLVLFV